MTIAIIQERLKSYKCLNLQEEDHALREITQEVILAGLARTDFFKYAQFHGGTCLRIFHGISRFSEDLDFVLERPIEHFQLEKYLTASLKELSAYGFKFEVVDRSKINNTVKKAFIKDNSIGKLLELKYIKPDRSSKQIKVKIEVDTNPPKGAVATTRYLAFPFPASITLHDVNSLFAGKLHALLCREYIKGRDWYDLIWYLSTKKEVNYELLNAQIAQSGAWKGKGQEVSKEWCFAQLKKKVANVNWDAAILDVRPFIKKQDAASLGLWSKDFFISIIEDYLR